MQIFVQRFFIEIDEIDLLLFLSGKWHIGPKNYVIGRIGKSRSLIRLNRAIAKAMGLDIEGYLVDHIDRNKFNYKRDNLRIATNGQNRANSSCSITNKIGYKGVYQEKRTGKFVAQIGFNKKNIWIGTFSTAEEAFEAYKAKARELHGEFANW